MFYPLSNSCGSPRSAFACLLVAAFASSARPSMAAAPAVDQTAEAARDALRPLIQRARERAPEVSSARASFVSSQSALVGGRLAPLGNPYLELTAQKSDKNVVKDLAVSGALWLPIEISGQRSSRKREADDYIGLNAVRVEAARASAAARTVKAYGKAVVAVERSGVLGQLLADARAESRMLAERMASGDAIQRDASLAAVEAARNEVMLAENEAELVSARGELAELVGGSEPPTLGPATPPSLSGGSLRASGSARLPRSRELAAQARYFDAAAERARREGRGLLSVGVLAGRGDYGETRVGGGLAYAFPAFRSNQAEAARDTAEGERARAERDLFTAVARQRLRVLRDQQLQLSRALGVLSQVALPAAQAAVAAVQETYEAGKAELFSVLLIRRELASLSLRRLELFERSWALVGDYVEITGDLP